MLARQHSGIISCIKVGTFEIISGSSRGLRFRLRKELELAEGDRVVIFPGQNPIASFWGRGTRETKGAAQVQIVEE